MRLILFSALWWVLLVGHLGKGDSRKGKRAHRQASHGNRYRRAEGGKRILAKLGGAKDRARAKKVSGGYAAARSGAGGKGEAPSGGKSAAREPDPSERFEDLPDDISEKQGAFLRSLLDKEMPDTYPNSYTGEPQLLGREDLFDYALLVNQPKPANRREASDLIDALKNGGPRAAARLKPEEAKRAIEELISRHGPNLSNFRQAAANRFRALPDDEKERMLDDRAAYRERIVNPLLKA